MIKLMNLTMPLGYTEAQLCTAVSKKLRIPVEDIIEWKYQKKSYDARKKPRIFVVLTLILRVKREKMLLKRFVKDNNVQQYEPYYYEMPTCSPCTLRPVVVGFGPAGMFAAYLLAKAGLKPLVLERGQSVELRQKAVASFRENGVLHTESNIQFGEGGAGTFSDGKLTTGINDFRIRFVLETFVQFGAPEEILYLAKPHIGTDYLVSVVRNMRNAIQDMGGEICFQSRLENLVQKNGCLTAIDYQNQDVSKEIPAQQCILAIGHSARDTFSMLYDNHIELVQKNFAVGVRVEHPQSMIDRAMFGEAVESKLLPAADYKLGLHFPNGKSLFTFCMCPGGEVVAAASENGRLVTNGMSYHGRNGENANSALLVGVSERELGSPHPLAGIAFQRKLEEAAFRAGGSNYYAPVCCVGDFLANCQPTSLGSVKPTYRPGVTLAALETYLPHFITDTLRIGIPVMAEKIPGFDMPDAVLTGVESRSSSPVRILRDASCQSVSVKGLYPCGEGAGYAGGIMSAAVDGMRCAEQLIEKLAVK